MAVCSCSQHDMASARLTREQACLIIPVLKTFILLIVHFICVLLEFTLVLDKRTQAYGIKTLETEIHLY